MGQDAKLEHRLAAIMATDVVGYSQSMQSDEAGTLAALGAIREATQNQITGSMTGQPNLLALLPLDWMCFFALERSVKTELKSKSMQQLSSQSRCALPIWTISPLATFEIPTSHE